MRNVTAILMGDPAARSTRVPTAVEMDRTRYREAIPCRGPEEFSVHKLSPIGQRVYAMQPGDTIAFEKASQARNFCHRMRVLRGWKVRVLLSGRRGGPRSAVLERLA